MDYELRPRKGTDFSISTIYIGMEAEADMQDGGMKLETYSTLLKCFVHR